MAWWTRSVHRACMAVGTCRPFRQPGPEAVGQGQCENRLPLFRVRASEREAWAPELGASSLGATHHHPLPAWLPYGHRGGARLGCFVDQGGEEGGEMGLEAGSQWAPASDSSALASHAPLDTGPLIHRMSLTPANAHCGWLVPRAGLGTKSSHTVGVRAEC